MATIAVSGVADKRVENEYEEVFQEHYQMIYRTAYSILNNAADAEDVLRTIFLQLIFVSLPNLPRFNVFADRNESRMTEMIGGRPFVNRQPSKTLSLAALPSTGCIPMVPFL
jgi:hypothetical protein